MKLKRLLILSLSLLTIVSCNKTIVQSSTTSSESSTSSEINESFESLSLTSEQVIFTSISVGDALIDINVNRWLCVGIDYKISFTFTETGDNQDGRVVSSHSDVLEPVKVSNGNYTLRALKQGDTILTIYDNRGLICYRNVVRVRNKIEQEDLVNFLVFEVDHFESWGINGPAQITFLNSSQALFTGKDGEVDVGVIQFTYEIVENEHTNDEYAFKITSFPNTSTEMICTYFNLDFTGSMLHLMTNNVIVDVFVPIMA